MRLFRLLSGLSVIAFFGLMFSTSVFAQANGSKPVEQVVHAEDVVNYALAYNVCSSTYITNSTYLAECQSDVSELSSLASTWIAGVSEGTLTVASNVQIEDELYNYEVALQTVLSESGYTYTASSEASSSRTGNRSLAYQISPDEISPDDASNTVVCTSCGVAASAGYYVCLTTIEAPPVALICGIGVAAGYVACAYKDCIAPTAPPQACGGSGTGG